MKAVILAAGKGTRLQPLTDSIPKGLVQVGDKPLLEHILENLVGLVTEVIFVVGYMGELVQSHFGSEYKGIKLQYVTQSEQLGTGHALLCAKEYLSGRFLVLNGDDLFAKEDIIELTHHDFGVLAHEVSNPSSFGVFRVDGTKMLELVEKPAEFVSNLANVGVYMLDERIFAHKLEKSSRGEYEIVDYLNFAKDSFTVDVQTISGYWYPVNNHEQLRAAEEFLK